MDRQAIMLRALCDLLTERMATSHDKKTSDLRDFVQHLMDSTTRNGVALATESMHRDLELLTTAMRMSVEAHIETNRLLAELVRNMSKPRPALQLKRADGSIATIQEKTA